MRGLRAIPANASLRTRRWDALILGGALPGLVAGVTLAMRGARILVLEEEAAARAFPGLREPFLLTNAERGSVLGACLRALGIALIDRQRVGSQELAYQVVLPHARLDVGLPARSAEEWVTWGLAKPEAARALVSGLAEAAAAERDALLAASVVRGGRAGRSRTTPGPPPRARGLHEPVAAAPPGLAVVLAAQVRALSQLGSAEPAPEARARLLGLALEGAAAAGPDAVSLRGLLRRRIAALHGEFRAAGGRLHLVSVGGLPGVALDDTDEVWTGRALLLNAPRCDLEAALAPDPFPEILRGPQPTGRRLTLHYRLARERLPAGMAARVIQVADPARPLTGTNVVTLRVFAPAAAGDGRADLVASTVVAPDAERAAAEAEIERGLRHLIPFSDGQLERAPATPARWDHDEPLFDPPADGGWPGASELRLSARPPILTLERGGLAGLGSEGDLLLGWRAGDAIASELT